MFKLNIFFLLQRLKDVAFPQAEVLKKALLRRFDQEYAQYLVKKVSCLSTPDTLKCVCFNIYSVMLRAF